jgi:hypothetical protein
MAVVYREGDDPFVEWPKERGREVYHFEPGRTLEEEEEVLEAGAADKAEGRS